MEKFSFQQARALGAFFCSFFSLRRSTVCKSHELLNIIFAIQKEFEIRRGKKKINQLLRTLLPPRFGREPVPKAEACRGRWKEKARASRSRALRLFIESRFLPFSPTCMPFV
jgi:hypothetical protein